jgi:hypothetical protein
VPGMFDSSEVKVLSQRDRREVTLAE